MGHFLEGFPSRVTSAEVIDISANSKYTNISRVDNGWCFYSIDSIRNLEIGEKVTSCFLGSTNKPKKTAILFRDSFTGSYEPFGDLISSLNNIQIQSVTTNWCHPSFKESFTGPTIGKAYKQCIFNRDFLKSRFADFDFVVLSGKWSAVLEKNQLADVFHLLAQMSPKAKLIIVMPSPKQYDASPILEFAEAQFLRSTSSFNINKISKEEDILAIKANYLLSEEAKKIKI
jgi:hypothetical protein